MNQEFYVIKKHSPTLFQVLQTQNFRVVRTHFSCAISDTSSQKANKLEIAPILPQRCLPSYCTIHHRRLNAHSPNLTQRRSFQINNRNRVTPFLNVISNNRPLDLLMIFKLIIPPRNHTRNHKRQTRHRSRKLPLLRLAIRLLDAQALRGANRVRQLLREVLVDQLDVCDFAGREKAQEVFAESAGPDGGGDGLAYGAADRGEHVLDGEDDGNVLVGCCGHDGDLLGDDLRCECQ